MEYMECPKELKSTAEAFAAHGERTIGEEIFAIEECAELIIGLTKLERNMYEYAGTSKQYMIDHAKQDLAQEIAHVYLILNHIRIAKDIPIDMIQCFMDAKINKYGFEVYKE